MLVHHACPAKDVHFESTCLRPSDDWSPWLRAANLCLVDATLALTVFIPSSANPSWRLCFSFELDVQCSSNEHVIFLVDRRTELGTASGQPHGQPPKPWQMESVCRAAEQDHKAVCCPGVFQLEAQRHPEDAARKACAKTACIEFLVARGAVVEVGASCEKCDHVGIPQDGTFASHQNSGDVRR